MNKEKGKPIMNRIQRFNSHVAMACILAFVFPMVAPSLALAGIPSPWKKSVKTTKSLGWDNVLKLKKGDRVIVTLFSKKLYQGKIEKVEPDSIGLSLGKNQSPLLIAKEQIQIVALDKKHSATKTGVILVAAGAALAVGGAVKANRDFTNCFNNAEMNLGSEPPGTATTCTTKNALVIPGVAVAAVGAGFLIFGRAPRFLYQVDAPPPAAPAPAQ
jgi:hypothetical protein